MSRTRVIILLAVTFLILLLGVGAGTWWYLFGTNAVEAAELVPSDTIFYATVPNAASLVAGYQTSQLKQLVDSPNSQPVSDTVVKWIGQKNLDVLNTFLPNLSGQSFFAVTHFDMDKPAQVGLIAGMRPKAGTESFDAFIEKLKTTWPDFLKQGTTGTGNVEGVDYQWLKGPGGSDKICVAKVKGWIITTWGEATLQDWLQRFHKKSITPSLAQNADYQKSISRLGPNPMTLIYVDYHAMITLAQQQIAKTNPAQSDYLTKKFGSIGGLAMGTRFENGEIVDRFSFMIPKQAQADSGMSTSPDTFETLKFTGPNTRLYWSSSMNWQQYWKNLEEQSSQRAIPNPFVDGIVHGLQDFAKNNGLDLQHNIIDPLGSEMSLQLEWNDDSTYPEVGFFLKVDKPDDFKPTISALIESTRKQYLASAVITELKTDKQDFAALKFVQPTPVTFTVTESGPYLGLFTSQNLAVRSYSRDESVGLPHVADFARQIGDKRNGASQIAYVDTPRILDRSYRTALPYVSLLSMLNKDLAASLQGKTLPPDLTWLAPMGTWSYVMTSDDLGVQGYSVSGIGNQGIFLCVGASGALIGAQSMGLLSKIPGMSGAPAPAPVAPPPPPPTAPADPSTATPAPADMTPPATTPPPATDTATPPPAAPAAPDATTPPSTPPPADSTPPATTPTPPPDAPKSQ